MVFAGPVCRALGLCRDREDNTSWYIAHRAGDPAIVQSVAGAKVVVYSSHLTVALSSTDV